MSAVSQKVYVDPEWVVPLLQAIDEKFGTMVSKVKSVSILRFELNWSRNLKGDEKKTVFVPEKPGLMLFPECHETTDIFEWNFPLGVKVLAFDQNLFRRHILEKAVELSEQTDCFIIFQLTLIGPSNVEVSEKFTIKQCPKSHAHSWRENE